MKRAAHSKMLTVPEPAAASSSPAMLVDRRLKFHISVSWQAGGNMGQYIGSIANPGSVVSANATRLGSWWFEPAPAHSYLLSSARRLAPISKGANDDEP